MTKVAISIDTLNALENAINTLTGAYHHNYSDRRGMKHDAPFLVEIAALIDAKDRLREEIAAARDAGKA